MVNGERNAITDGLAPAALFRHLNDCGFAISWYNFTIMEVILPVEHLRRHFSAEPVLVDVCFMLRAGDKVGLFFFTASTRIKRRRTHYDPLHQSLY